MALLGKIPCFLLSVSTFFVIDLLPAGNGRSLVLADPACWPNVNGFEIVWAVDKSDMIQTTLGVPRGDRGLPITPWNAGYNGASVNVYGGKGLMPHVRGGNISVNGGVPQDGDLAAHLSAFDTHFAAMVTNTSWDGYCLLDYEWWRLEWNATQPTVRYWSVNVAGLDEERAQREFEEAAMEFLLATVNKTREMRPNCKIGHYGYPQNYLPHIATVQFNNWCSWNPGTCWWTSYSEDHQPRPQPAGSVEIKKQMNEDILLPFLDHLDVITPSLYLGILEAETTPEMTEAYINTTIQESRRLAELVYERRLARDPSTAVRPKVMPYTWFVYNNFWQVPGPTARDFLTPADARRQFELPMWNGADGIIIWGAIDDSVTYASTSYGSVPLQNYMDTVLNPLFDEMLCAHWPPPPSATKTDTSAATPSHLDGSKTVQKEATASLQKDVTQTIQHSIPSPPDSSPPPPLSPPPSPTSDQGVSPSPSPGQGQSSSTTGTPNQAPSPSAIPKEGASSSTSSTSFNDDGDTVILDPPAAAKGDSAPNLSPGAKTGISVGVVLVVSVVAGGVGFGCWRVHQARKKGRGQGRRGNKDLDCTEGCDDVQEGDGNGHPEDKYLSVSPQECSMFDQHA